MRELKGDDFKAVVYGASFYGGGGGGSMEEGMELVEEMLRVENDPVLEMYDIEELPDDPNAVATMVAAMGSPIETKGMTFVDEAVSAISGMAEEVKAKGQELKYIYSGEMGGGNTILPLYAALKCGLPIVDTDGNGRAVPEMNTSLAPIHGVPTSPFMIANGNGDVLAVRAKDPMDSVACEKIGRCTCSAFKGVGFSAWNMNKEDMRRASAAGQMTKCMEVGRVLLDSTTENVIENLSATFEKFGDPFKVLVPSGEIVDIQIESAGGFDTGSTVIRDDATGETYTVLCQNESLLVRDGAGQVIMTIPGIISMVELRGDGTVRAVSNCETAVGQKVALTVTKAHERWYDRPECYGSWKEVMESAGYTGEEVSL